jgi:hypothetical protein
VARPRKKIDPMDLEQYAALGFTMEEIAVLSDCSVDTLERRFADAIKKGRLKDKVSFMRKVRAEAMGDAIKVVENGEVKSIFIILDGKANERKSFVNLERRYARLYKIY